MTMDAATIRAELNETRARLASRDELITAGADAGLSKTELATLSGLSRQHIYDVLARHADAKRKAAESEVETVAAMWELGLVIEDRWGLRWRADIAVNGPGQHVWFCRSVGLRVRLSSERMAARGPIKRVRLDCVFAGDEAKAERLAGEAEDVAVTVEPHEDEEP